jgi:hypothetical protein
MRKEETRFLLLTNEMTNTKHTLQKILITKTNEKQLSVFQSIEL